MGYLVQKTRAASLTIGGVDYTSSFIEFTVSDSSAYRNGLIVTSGTLFLGKIPGSASNVDYDRDLFKRGTPVILDMTEPGGSVYRHPRGYLYIVGVIYDVEQDQIEIELGCKLALAYLNDDTTDVLPLIPVPLDDAQQTIQGCSASFAAAGKYLYQNNQGSLVSGSFFAGDNNSGAAAGEWVSVLSDTALSIRPLAGAEAVPDEILLSYQIPSGPIAADTNSNDRVDTTTETSDYFLSYPASTWTRTEPADCVIAGPDGEFTPIACVEDGDSVDGGITIPETPSSGGSVDACGNAPPPPVTNPVDPAPTNPVPIPVPCNYGWETVATPTFVSAQKVTTSITEYKAPGGQVSLTRQEVEGPALELNRQYYADKYAYCTQLYGYACNPNGSCPMEGLDTVLQGYETTENFYGGANELVRQVRETYETTLSAAQPFDWRSGVLNGVPQQFDDTLSETAMYRSQRVETDYIRSQNTNTQITTTYTSAASRSVGINSGSIDAMDGIKTTVKRVSVTTGTLEIRPDSVNTITTNTEERSARIILKSPGYSTPPTESGPYVVDASIPVPLLYGTSSERAAIVDSYSDYLKRFIEGDTFGLQLAEALRADIVTNWRPGMPFRYADTANNQIVAMRMDACSWGVNKEESVVVTNGIWTGFSSGTLSVGDNLVGNSAPDMGSGTTPPSAPSGPPSIINDQVGRGFTFVVEIDMALDMQVTPLGNDGIVPVIPSDLNASIEMTEVVFVGGIIVAAGGVLETTASGGIPLSAGGQLVVNGATVVNANVFGS